MDIYGYLRRENARLFDQLETVAESSDHALHKLLLNDIQRHLPRYLDVKLEALYQALRDHPAGHYDGFVRHRGEIHHALDAVFSARDDGQWMHHFDALRVAVLRHLDDEEHAVFQAARRHLGGKQASKLKKQMEAAMAAPTSKAA